MARDLLSLFLSLSLLALSGVARPQTTAVPLAVRGATALGVGAAWQAQGNVHWARGDEGSFTVAVAAGGRCRIEFDLRGAHRERQYVAVADGVGLYVHAEGGLDPGARILTRAAGCALLPQGLNWGALTASATPNAVTLGNAATVSLDGDSGLPVSVSWSEGSHQVEIEYRDFTQQSGVSCPATVIVSVDGAVRLQFTGIELQPGGSAADFTVPAPPTGMATGRKGHGGGQ